MYWLIELVGYLEQIAQEPTLGTLAHLNMGDKAYGSNFT